MRYKDLLILNNISHYKISRVLKHAFHHITPVDGHLTIIAPASNSKWTQIQF